MAQIADLLYRRMAFGCGFAVVRQVRTAEALRITNPRHSRLPVCATPANRASSFGDARHLVQTCNNRFIFASVFDEMI